jgi:diaminopimelate decarboxylase
MKFGIPYDRAVAAAARAASLPGINLAGLDFHIGSQISDANPYRAALQRLEDLVGVARSRGANHLRYLDVGGGLGVTYDTELPLDARQFAEMVVPASARLGLQLIVEPGRFLLGAAGIMVARVLDRKHSGGKDFLIVDAGMNDLLRPSLYSAFHAIEPVSRSDGTILVDVVGPVCESGDFLGLDRTLPELGEGDLIAVRMAGAYGFCMSSNYNSRPRAAEVLIDGNRIAVLRDRESFEDLVRNEHALLNWRTEG